jgi:hypothetical protein
MPRAYAKRGGRSWREVKHRLVLRHEYASCLATNLT